MTTDEQQTWEMIVERVLENRPSVVDKIEQKEHETRLLEAYRQLLCETDAVIAANAELIRLRGQEG